MIVWLKVSLEVVVGLLCSVNNGSVLFVLASDTVEVLPLVGAHGRNRST